jgi:hypothetical protein
MTTLEVKVGSRVLGEIEVTTDYDNYNDWLKTLSQDNIDEILSTARLSVPISGPLNRFTITQVTSTQYVLRFNEYIYGGEYDSIYKALGKANGTFARRGSWLLSAILPKNGFNEPEAWTPSDLPSGVTLWLHFNDLTGINNDVAGTLNPRGTFSSTSFTNDGGSGPVIQKKGGNKVLEFEDSGQDFYSSQLSTPNFSTINNRFIQILAKPEGVTGNQTAYALGGTTNRIYFSEIPRAGTDRTVFSNLRTGDVSLGTVTGNPWTLVSHSYEDEGDPDSGGGQLKGFLNTALTSTINDEDAEPITATDELTLGDPLGTVDPFLQGFVGFIADLVLLSYIPTEIERKKLEGWHCHTFGLSSLLPSDHLFKNFAPNK